MPIDSTATIVPAVKNTTDGEVTAIPTTVHPLAAMEGSYKALADYIIKLEADLKAHLDWHKDRDPRSEKATH